MGSKNLKRYLKKILLFFCAVISISNILAVWLFWGWVKRVEIQGVINFDFSQYLTVQAYQNSVFQVYWVIFSLGLGLLGVYGFSQIKNSAEDAAREVAEKTSRETAEKKAEEVAKKIVEDFLSNTREQLDMGKPSFPYSKKKGGKKKKEGANA